jgi:futalosine hydrolase
MKILIVAATWNEIKPLEQYLLRKDEQKAFSHHSIELLVTGPGSMLTGFRLGKMLPIDNWDLAINLGVCGSFNKDLIIGSTVNIIKDTLADLGAEDEYNFLNAFDLELLKADEFPFENGWIKSRHHEKLHVIASLAEVTGITVNTVSGNDFTIARRISQYHPDVESMEGAAFMYCCLKESIPFLQLRAISNYVEKRNKNNWNISLAIDNLNATAIQVIEEAIERSEKEKQV